MMIPNVKVGRKFTDTQSATKNSVHSWLGTLTSYDEVVQSLVSDRERLPGLDGLRALAVIGVLAFHDGRLSGGFLGVDLFFAVSGFLITTILLRECVETNRVDLMGFWGRRLRRLFPAVMVLLVAVVIIGRFFADTGQWIMARRDAPWAQFYAANWHQISSGRGYWDAFAQPSAFEHLWSLAIEEQFYVLWPIAVFMLWRWGQMKAITAATIGGFFASAMAMIALYGGGDPTRMYMGTDTRAFSLLAGALVALPAVRGPITKWSARRPAAAAITLGFLMLLLGVSWFVVSGTDPWLFRGGLAIHALIGAMIALLVTMTGGPLAKILTWPALEYVGRLSYALYLWHWPVFIFCSTDRLHTDGWALTSIRLLITGFLSVLSYHFVEQAIRLHVRWAHGQQGRWALVITSMMAIGVWVAIDIPSSTNAVNASAVNQALATTTAPALSAPSSTAVTTTPNNTTTTIAKVLENPIANMYYFGDSVAYDMWPGLEALLMASGIAAHSGAFGGVGIVPTAENRMPLEKLALALDTYQPDLLMVQLSVWDASQNDEAQKMALTQLTNLVTLRNIRLVFVSFPSLAPEHQQPGQQSFEQSARDIASPADDSIWYFDQSAALGPTFVLDIDGDGNPERKRDGIHVCPTGALRVAQWMVNELTQHFAGVQLPAANDWMLGSWSADPRYDSPPGACAHL